MLRVTSRLNTHRQELMQYLDVLSPAEVGKNINQDKNLAIQRYVEGYHELVSKMAAQEEKDQSDLEDKDGHEEVLQYSAKQGERQVS